MESFDLSLTESGLHVNGFPDAAMVIKLTGPKPRQLADLGLHKFDLELALESLEGINSVPSESRFVRMSLWHSAIEHCLKCYRASKSRTALRPNKVFKGDSEALEVFEYFKSLRNKHIAHDENSYMQCIPGAVLQNPGMEYKIAKIIYLSAVADTLDQESYSNLHKLITESLNYVNERADRLCEDITEELESQPYEELSQMENMTYSKPRLEDIDEPRPLNS